MKQNNDNENDPGKSYNHNYVCMILAQIVKLQRSCRTKLSKQICAIAMFDILLQYREFVDDNPDFKQTAKRKLEEFAENSNFRLEQHYIILFGEPLPIF